MNSFLDAKKDAVWCPCLNCPRKFENQEQLNGHLAACGFKEQEVFEQGKETKVII